MNINNDLLIQKIKDNPPIWDRTNKSYANRICVETCWKNISTEMNVDQNALRKKWKYLRDQFSVELGKVVGSDDSGVVGTKWPFFESLLFLKGMVKARKTGGNISSDNDSSNLKYELLIKEELEDRGNIDHLGNALFNENDDDETYVAYTSSPSNSPGPTIAKRRRSSWDDTLSKSLLQIEEQKLQYLQEKVKKVSECDEDEMFFKSLLPHVRKMKDSMKMSFRIKVQQIVDEYVYRTESPNIVNSSMNNRTSPSPT